ncbi:universal stress protein [Ramlibacter sp. AN1015]|uniref:universal stress protein n=1 Tax=Ramlibacter sp. AN1015 TaxID=3133428 RepID=UPI0030C52F2F
MAILESAMLDIRSILVHLDDPQSAVPRLQLAHRLALAHDASVTVVYAAVPSLTFAPFPEEGGALVVNALMDIDEQRRRDTREAFEKTAAATGLRAQWTELEGAAGIANLLGLRAMYADLLVLGQHQTTSAGGAPGDFAEMVLARSGRSAVLVPFAIDPPASLRRVAIAWKETPEAARALAAALPILRRASEVHVLSWGGEPTQWRPRLQHYLGSHGVDPIWHDGGPEPKYIGEIILSTVADLSCDMLVMGCYGHSRAREWLLGGATRTLLSSMTLPVLMAH